MARLWILVVDDQEPVRDLIADILVADGHDVRTAENGVEALRLLGEQEYDVILSGMMMPEMDGQQLYDEIARRWPPIVARKVFVTGRLRSRALLTSWADLGGAWSRSHSAWRSCALRLNTPKGQAPRRGNAQSRPGAKAGLATRQRPRRRPQPLTREPR